MNKNEFAFIASRLLALYWGLYAVYILSISGASQILLLDSDMYIGVDFLLLSYAPTLILILISASLWVFAKYISYRLIDTTEDSQNSPDPIDIENVLSVAISILGLYTIMTALPDIGSYAYKYAFMNQTDLDPSTLVNERAQIIGLSVSIIAGFLMIIGARRLTLILIMIRYTGAK